MDNIIRHFPGLSERQKSQLERIGPLYHEWNAKVNVISRKDIDNLYVKHVLHSLSMVLFFGQLSEGTSIIDIGTGGGFPGIPLAIAYPGCHFHLIDRIGKKINVAREIATTIGLDNISFQHGDIGECHERFDYVVSRAVMPLNQLVRLTVKNVKKAGSNGNRYSPGLVCLKGGDLEEESRGISFPVIEYPLNEFLDEECFSTKKLVYIPMAK